MPLNSSFASRVYEATSRIPKGRVATYGQIAEIIDCKGGARAVGNALHCNPYAPIVPCHRVVAADGRLADHFGGGGPLIQKQRLEAEGILFDVEESPNTYRVNLAEYGISVESHPLKPFLPRNGRVLFLGSFPPPKSRWSMDFFYPNYINDFWRVMGLIHFSDPKHFEIPGEKRFNRSLIIDFCNQHGYAFFDTAQKVCRLKGNASDEFLQILQPTDVLSLLAQMPDCHTIVTTGGKSSEELQTILHTSSIPKLGESLLIQLSPEMLSTSAGSLHWHRFPSTSRAYPMSLTRKAEYYRKLTSD